jgi:hypothetical protein
MRYVTHVKKSSRNSPRLEDLSALWDGEPRIARGDCETRRQNHAETDASHVHRYRSLGLARSTGNRGRYSGGGGPDRTPTVMSSVTSRCGKHSGHRDHCSGHRDRHSNDHDQLDRDHPGIMIAITPEPLFGMSRNTDRHGPESPRGHSKEESVQFPVWQWMVRENSEEVRERIRWFLSVPSSSLPLSRVQRLRAAPSQATMHI